MPIRDVNSGFGPKEEKDMAGNGSDAGFEVIISSDSHVMEPSDIIVERAPNAFKDQVPRFPKLQEGSSFQTHPGGSDPT